MKYNTCSLSLFSLSFFLPDSASPHINLPGLAATARQISLSLKMRTKHSSVSMRATLVFLLLYITPHARTIKWTVLRMNNWLCTTPTWPRLSLQPHEQAVCTRTHAHTRARTHVGGIHKLSNIHMILFSFLLFFYFPFSFSLSWHSRTVSCCVSARRACLDCRAQRPRRTRHFHPRFLFPSLFKTF